MIINKFPTIWLRERQLCQSGIVRKRLKIIFLSTLPNPVVTNFLTQKPHFDNQAVSQFIRLSLISNILVFCGFLYPPVRGGGTNKPETATISHHIKLSYSIWLIEQPKELLAILTECLTKYLIINIL